MSIMSDVTIWHDWRQVLFISFNTILYNLPTCIFDISMSSREVGCGSTIPCSVKLPLALDMVTSGLHLWFCKSVNLTVCRFLPAVWPAVCFHHITYYTYVTLRQSRFGTVHRSLWNYVCVVHYARCGKSHVPSADGPPLPASVCHLNTYQVIILTRIGAHRNVPGQNQRVTCHTMGTSWRTPG